MNLSFQIDDKNEVWYEKPTCFHIIIGEILAKDVLLMSEV